MPDRPQSLDWSDDGRPRSRLYGDVYFSSDDGLAESRGGLPGRLRPAGRLGRAAAVHGRRAGLRHRPEHRRPAELWRETRPPGAGLHVFSVEAHPLDARRRRPRPGPLAGARPGRAGPARPPGPGGRPGFHRVDLPDFDAVLDLAVLPVGEALAGWDGRGRRLVPRRLLAGPQPGHVERGGAGRRSPPARRPAPGRRPSPSPARCGAAWRRPASRSTSAPGFGRKRERLEAVAARRGAGSKPPVHRHRRRRDRRRRPGAGVPRPGRRGAAVRGRRARRRRLGQSGRPGHPGARRRRRAARAALRPGLRPRRRAL